MKKIVTIFFTVVFLSGTLLLISGCQPKPDDSDLWVEKIKCVKIGMRRADVEKILPPYLAVNRIRDRVITPANQCLLYDLDDKWKVYITYDLTGSPRDRIGRFLGLDSPENRVTSEPVLTLAASPNWDPIDSNGLAVVKEEEYSQWQWRKLDEKKTNLNDSGQNTLNQLQSLGYLSGYEIALEKINVTRHDKDKTSKGINLYTSGHAAEAFLIDSDGNVLHKWEYKGTQDVNTWRRVYLMENGDLLVIKEGDTLTRISKDSEEIWSATMGFHHGLDFSDDGRIYSLTRVPEYVPEINKNQPILTDHVTILSRDGELIEKFSIQACFLKSRFASSLDKMNNFCDTFHTNEIDFLDGSQAGVSDIFKKGNILISIRELNLLAIIDPSLKEVVWALTGQWVAQHSSILLDNGHILLFDNQGHNGMSKVIEIDPLTQKTIWAYCGTPENGFFSKECGSCQRLPNGNTLIVESHAGRAFEVTEDNEIVWEFYNPARAGKQNELVATLFDFVRLDPGFTKAWL